MSIGSVVAGIGSIAGGILGAQAARRASGQLQSNIQQGIQTQQNMFNTAQGALAPYYSAGSQAVPGLFNAANAASGLAGTYNPQIAGLNQPNFNALASQYAINSNWGGNELQNTPGYQFTLNQGLNAIQNSNAARGLGLSGNALKAASDYASGLASTTYQQQYQNYADAQRQNFMQGLQGGQQTYQNALQNLQQQFGNALQGNASAAQILQSIYGTGANAANALGSNAVSAGNAIAQNYGALGNAQAAGTLGASNSYRNMLGSLGGMAMGGLTDPFSSLFGGGAQTQTAQPLWAQTMSIPTQPPGWQPYNLRQWPS